MLTGLIRLRSLDVSSNQLARIDDGALATMAELEQLNLRDNCLATIGPNLVKVSTKSCSFPSPSSSNYIGEEKKTQNNNKSGLCCAGNIKSIGPGCWRRRGLYKESDEWTSKKKEKEERRLCRYFRCWILFSSFSFSSLLCIQLGTYIAIHPSIHPPSSSFSFVCVCPHSDCLEGQISFVRHKISKRPND